MKNILPLQRIISILSIISILFAVAVFPVSAYSEVAEEVTDYVASQMENYSLFTDTEYHWANGYIQIAAAVGYMNGIGNHRFDPNGTVSRAMVVQVLYNLARTPSTKAKSPFTDVNASAWYYSAVNWAFENEIACGTSNTKFSPEDSVTREQLITFLYRYIKFCGYSEKGYYYTDAKANINSFYDRGKVSTYAKDSVLWALGNQIINGRSATELAPHASATRAELAKIIVCFASNTSSKRTSLFGDKLTEQYTEEEIDSNTRNAIYNVSCSLSENGNRLKTAFISNGFKSTENFGGKTVELKDYGVLLWQGQIDGAYNDKGPWTAVSSWQTNAVFAQDVGLFSSNVEIEGQTQPFNEAFSMRETYLLDSILAQDCVLASANIFAQTIKAALSQKYGATTFYVVDISATFNYERSERWDRSSSNTGRLWAEDFAYIEFSMSIGYK